MTEVDQRITLAREYLTGARRRKVDQLPPSVLVRELAETRRQLGQVLDVVNGQTAPLTAAQLSTVLDALDVAADYRRDRVETCTDCPGRPEGLCHTCAWRLDLADGYDALARELGGQQ
jgi:hypothetical protein